METKSEVLEVPMRRIQKSIGALLQGFVLSKGAKDQREHFMPGRIFFVRDSEIWNKNGNLRLFAEGFLVHDKHDKGTFRCHILFAGLVPLLPPCLQDCPGLLKTRWRGL